MNEKIYESLVKRSVEILNQHGAFVFECSEQNVEKKDLSEHHLMVQRNGEVIFYQLLVGTPLQMPGLKHLNWKNLLDKIILAGFVYTPSPTELKAQLGGDYKKPL